MIKYYCKPFTSNVGVLMSYGMLPSQLANQVPVGSRKVGGVPRGGYYLELECKVGATLSNQYAKIKALLEVKRPIEYVHTDTADLYTIRLKADRDPQHAESVRAKIEVILGSMNGRSLTIVRQA